MSPSACRHFHRVRCIATRNRAWRFQYGFRHRNGSLDWRVREVRRLTRSVSESAPREHLRLPWPQWRGQNDCLRMVLGLLRPVSGEIRLFGQPLEGALPGILRRVGSLIEQPSLYDHLTGRQNIEIARKLKLVKQSDAERAVEAVGIGEYVGKRVAGYSPRHATAAWRRNRDARQPRVAAFG